MQHYDDKLLLDAQLCFPLYAAARKVVNLYGPVFRPLGITYTQYIVFLVLWEKDGISVGELGRRLYLDNGTLTPMLKKMEKAGWLTRSRSLQDERVVIISLTEAGRALREQARDIPAKVGACIDLAPEKAAQLYDLLYELLGDIHSPEADQ
jgi:DNA-binding MarR family transcriptional regulator